MGVQSGGSLWGPGLENVSCGPQIHALLFLSNRGSASQPQPCSPSSLPSSCRLDRDVPEVAWDRRMEDGAVRAEDTGSLASMVPELQSWPQTAQPRLFWKGEISLSLT